MSSVLYILYATKMLLQLTSAIVSEEKEKKSKRTFSVHYENEFMGITEKEKKLAKPSFYYLKPL